MNLGFSIYYGLESNEYLNKLYNNILYNHSISLLELSLAPKEINVEDALRFADILSKSNHPNQQVSEKHKIWAQEIVALIYEMELKKTSPEQNVAIKQYFGSVLSNVGNYRGINIKAPDYFADSIWDISYDEFSKEILKVPGSNDKHFFRSQKHAYDNFNKSYFSFSGPTSMGKSFIIQSFIKEHILSGEVANFAIIVPTKALINEISSSLINELKSTLIEKNYRVVTSANAIALEQTHSYIFVLTPERLLYLFIRHEKIKINYLFIDEAHKISSAKDSRSAFYYKDVDMLLNRNNNAHIIFASPNIPNPEVYLNLIPNSNKNDHKLRTSYSPVTQIKYFIDFVEKKISVHNDYSQQIVPIVSNYSHTFNETLRLFYNKNSSSIVYINARDEAMKGAQDFAKELPYVWDPNTNQLDKDLEALSNEIRNQIHKDYFLANVVLKGVAYHVGYLPPSIRTKIEALFRDQKIKIVFCTSTLLEGVNLPADNLFITTYRKGGKELNEVDFRNLIGRVGRIRYNLYGNVFFTRLLPSIKMNKFEKYLKSDVPKQKLSLITEIKETHKQLIIDFLSQGKLDLPTDSMNEDEYSLVRKFTLILLRDIMNNNRNSIVYKAFEPLLNDNLVCKIKNAFEQSDNQPDDDINISVDQTNRLTNAIQKEDLKYPTIDDKGRADYSEVLYFLRKLYDIFRWDIYEPKYGIGNEKSLSWYATLLCQWVSGYGLSYIMQSAINNARSRMFSNNPKTVRLKGMPVEYNDSILHQNLVINDALSAIESTILFSFSNYFLKFTESYKKIKKRSPQHDWYEFVEYGTTNSLSILLQRNGFSREASLYIKENKDAFVVTVQGVPKLKRSLVTECPKESVRNEISELVFNAPELFLD